jgi:hypothetical protein
VLPGPRSWDLRRGLNGDDPNGVIHTYTRNHDQPVLKFVAANSGGLRNFSRCYPDIKPP